MLKKKIIYPLSISLIALTVFLTQKNVDNPIQTKEAERVAYEKYINEHKYAQIRYTQEELSQIPKGDRPDLAWEQNYLATMNPALGIPEPEKLFPIVKRTKQMQQFRARVPGQANTSWVERGPNNVAGDTKAIAWDPNTANKVWAGSATGGLWYNNDITDPASSWQSVDGFWSNINISVIAFDKRNPKIMYIGTGSGRDTEVLIGAGIWKSTDGGQNFTQIQSTKKFYFISDIVIRKENGISVIYAGVGARSFDNQRVGNETQGLQRSDDGGETWNQVLPVFANSVEYPTDLEISTNNTLYVGVGQNIEGRGGGRIYSSVNGITYKLKYAEPKSSGVFLACAPSDSKYIYAAFIDHFGFKELRISKDFGLTWVSKTRPKDIDIEIKPTDFTNEQAWHNLCLAVDPNDPLTVVIGGVNLFKTKNGGGVWTQISHYAGSFGLQKVHEDHRSIVYKPGSSDEILFGNDGGVAHTSTGKSASPTITHRNKDLNITQFYAAAIHPAAKSNYFLAGSQDNGTQQFNFPGINATTPFASGDGGFCFIDQVDPNIQLISNSHNRWKASDNNGSSFKQLRFPMSPSLFINPAAYDSYNKYLFFGIDNSNIHAVDLGKIKDPEKGEITINNIPILMGSMVTHLSVSPYTTFTTTLFIGTRGGRVFKVANANEYEDHTRDVTEITEKNFPFGSVSCITFGASENEILVTFSNYGITSVWYTNDGGNNWVSKEGNLPDMPVRWALFNPNNFKEVILATELGVWKTTDLNSASPSWTTSNSGLSNVRVNMLKMRASDNEVIAATYGRGLFSSNAFTKFTVDFTASPLKPSSTSKISALHTTRFESSTTRLPTSWNWVFSPNTITYQNGTNANSQNPEVIFNDDGEYTVTLLASDGESDDTKIKKIKVEPPFYCTPDGNGLELFGYAINNIKIGKINHTSFSTYNSYRDFNHVTTNLYRGVLVDFEVTCNVRYPKKVANTTPHINLWIDLNQDFDFSDPGERILTSVEIPLGTPYKTSFMIPSSAELGPTSFRVQVTDSNFPSEVDPCLFVNSEVKDYGLIIKDSPSELITWTDQPLNITLDSKTPTLPVNTGGYAIATTDCPEGGGEMSYTDEIIPGPCANTFETRRRWTFTSKYCGSTIFYTQSIYNQDITAPTIYCPGTQTQKILYTESIPLEDYRAKAIAFDDCSSPENITITQYPAKGYNVRLGNTSVTLTATDQCGNASSCTFIVRVILADAFTWVHKPPHVEIDCKASTSVESLGKHADATGTCNIGGLMVYADKMYPGHCANSYEIRRTWTISDGCNRKDTYEQSIFIRDRTLPVITNCPGEKTQDAINGFTTTLNDYTPFGDASDNCSTSRDIKITQTPAPGSIVNVGRLDVSFNATDECGNVGNCGFRVNILNVSSITWMNQPKDIITECFPSNYSISTGVATASTTCLTGVQVSYSDGIQSINNESVINRLWIATDDCNNRETFLQKITVKDITPPTITGPTDHNISLPNGESFVLNNYTTQGIVSDNCTSVGKITITQIPAAGSIHNRGPVDVTLTATDESGNSANYKFEVVNIKSLLNSQPTHIRWAYLPTNTTVDCDASNLPLNTGIATALTTCSSGVTVTYADAVVAGSCVNTSVLKRTWIAIDNCNNSERFDQIITIQDVSVPTIKGPVTQNQSAPNGIYTSLNDYTGMAIFSDNCSANENIIVTQIPAIGSTQNVGAVDVTLTATDECENAATYNFKVTITNTSDIAWTKQPENTTIDCEASNFPENTGTATAITTCEADGLEVKSYDTIVAGSCANTSVLTRTWIATDNCGNSKFFDQLITIQDVSAPTITGPVTQNQNATNGNYVALSDYTAMATLSDNCSATENITVTQSPAIGSTQNVGTVDVALTATDECGNAAAYNFKVTITNTSAIAWIHQPTNITIECDASNLPENTGIATAITTCGADSLEVSYSETIEAGSCANTAVLTRTWIATDDCGNSEFFDQLITIQDVSAPSITAPMHQNQNAINGNYVALSDYIAMATLSDNCSATENITVAQSPAIGSTQNVGTVDVTLTATDECGNAAAYNFNVTIINTSAIAWIHQPTNITIECDASNLPENTGIATAITTCGADSLEVSYSDTIEAGSCVNTAVLTRTWMATDDCGNSERFDQLITIQDVSAPTITGPVTQNQNTTKGIHVSLNDYTAMTTFSDNCSATENIRVSQSPAIGSIQNVGAVHVTLTATDECGNAAHYIFDVNIGTITSVADNTSVHISIYPNPNKGLFTIDLGTQMKGDISIQVYNLLGKIVYYKEKENDKTSYQLDLQHVEKGIYYVSIKGENQSIVKKVMIF